MSLTGTGIVVAVALALTPEGTIKKIVRLGASIILLLMVLRPIFHIVNMDWVFDTHMAVLTTEQGQEIALEAQKERIADRLSAYISAMGTGLDVDVNVVVEQGMLTIDSVEINYPRNMPITDIESITRRIVEGYGLPAYRQNWRKR